MLLVLGQRSLRRRSELSKLPLVNVHNWAAGTPYMVGESETLVETAGRLIRFIDADLHRVGSSSARFMECCLHECAAEPLATRVGNDIQLRQVALETTCPNGHPESYDSKSIWSIPTEDDNGVTSQEGLEALCEDLCRWTWLAELFVEAVQQSTDGADIIHLGDADGVSSFLAHPITVSATPR
jgi:hypothetical protein